MRNLIISVFGNKVFNQILNELNLFPDSKITSFDNNDKNILESNYQNICSPGTELRDNEAIALEKNNKVKKPRKKIVLFQ